MKVETCMSKEIVSCGGDCSIKEAAQKMKSQNVGSIIITEGDSVKGLLTDRDIAISLADGLDPNSSRVQQIMHKNPVTTEPGTDIDDAIRKMKENNVRRLPVLQNNRLVGVLSWHDCAHVIKEELDNFLSLDEVFSKTMAGTSA